ncbi:uncharacterized protein LOC110032547 [Phalaenopsis equestris]|uniref:uncharacterized protein LOC110032547 n=1 Tax=Phalaenopsis equestris TaxID=78828 RepID=UPI0009E5F4E4|nr:uncharacterized protein LOC110032547 [Phalaenopsis equestris]
MEEANQLFNFFSLIFEVFITEFSENVGLNKHLISVNILSTNSEKLCECHKTHVDNCIVLRFVFSHFLQLVRNDQDFSGFLHSLSGSSDIDKMIPEISLDVSLKLISIPFIFSAPLIIQAHLILLASRCISTHLPIDGGKSDTPLTSCYINPFELSANLYLSYLSTLQLDGDILGTNGRSNLGDSSGHKMNLDRHTHQAYFVDFSHLYSEDILSGTKSQVIAYSASYIRGDHPLIDRLCQEATYLVVDHMIKSIIPMEAWEQRRNENEERIRQEVYCLAAAMKLMNSSLLNILWILRQTGSHNEMKALRVSLLSKAFKCLSQSVSIIRIGGCRTDQKVQNVLYNMFGAYGGMHQEIKFMLMHISSFLVFSFKRKFDFLWKGCISMMMTLMNLLLLEEGNLGLSKIFKLLENSQSLDFEGLTYRNTNVIIARNLEKTRMLYLKTEIKYVHVEDNRTDAGERNAKTKRSRSCSVAHESQENTCNGERFINCIPSYHTNPSEWKDLVDFIECRPEKDYCSWLKNRNKFNKWKQEKSVLFKSRKKERKACIKKSL